MTCSCELRRAALAILKIREAGLLEDLKYEVHKAQRERCQWDVLGCASLALILQDAGLVRGDAADRVAVDILTPSAERVAIDTVLWFESTLRAQANTAAPQNGNGPVACFQRSSNHRAWRT